MNELTKMSDGKLVDLLFSEADRLPRAAVEEVLRRGGMTERLGSIVVDPFNWNEPLPAWWAPVHAVYILGAVGTEETILPLCRALRYAEACENDWVTEDLPSIFGRIGARGADLLTAMARDRTSGWLVRVIALEGLAAMTLHDPSLAGSVFSLVRGMFSDRTEDHPVRQNAGNILIDFLHEECRSELLTFGEEEQARRDRDGSAKVLFTDRDVKQEFSRGVRATEHYVRDWLQFYDPASIAERQLRWDTERIEKASSPEHRIAAELCPLAPDKNHRKCCMGKVGLA